MEDAQSRPFQNRRLLSVKSTGSVPFQEGHRAQKAKLYGSAIFLVGCWSALPIAWAIWHTSRHGGWFTGADGYIPLDQLQYMAWIREASSHFFIGNLFGGAKLHRVYLNPMSLLSGALLRLGFSMQVAALVWKPVAVVTLCIGVLQMARRYFPGRLGEQIACFLLALFPLTPVVPFLMHSSAWSPPYRYLLRVLAPEFTPGVLLWGYSASVIAVGLMPIYLSALLRILETPSHLNNWRSRPSLVAALIGCLLSFAHSWQGATMILVTIGLVATLPFRREMVARVWFPVLCTALPLVYFRVLALEDMSWRIFAAQDRYPSIPTIPVVVLAAVVGPILLVAALGVTKWPGGPVDRALVLWIAAAVGVYIAVPELKAHALNGLSLPLSVLAVRGGKRLSLSGMGGAAIVSALTLTSVVYFASLVRSPVTTGTFATADAGAALRYLRLDHHEGTVLTSEEYGLLVPAFTGHSTWIGHPIWTPDPQVRSTTFQAFAAGDLTPSRIHRLLDDAGARWVLLGCGDRPLPVGDLGGLVGEPHQFGCLALYEVTRMRQQTP